MRKTFRGLIRKNGKKMFINNSRKLFANKRNFKPFIKPISVTRTGARFMSTNTETKSDKVFSLKNTSTGLNNEPFNFSLSGEGFQSIKHLCDTNANFLKWKIIMTKMGIVSNIFWQIFLGYVLYNIYCFVDENQDIIIRGENDIVTITRGENETITIKPTDTK